MGLFTRNFKNEYLLGVEGMHCAHCEASVCNAIKEAYPGVRVSADHPNNSVKVKSNQELDENVVKTIISELGFNFVSIEKVK